MRKFSARAIRVLLCGSMVGCGGMSDQDRLKILVPNAQATTPVRGKVLVDGEPVKDLWVKLHPVEGDPKSLKPKGQTATDGTFQITTYIGGDGAPWGDYKITVEWLTFQQLGNQWTGPSKLDGPCGDAATTEYSVTVEDQAVSLPTFEVNAKPDADQVKPRPGGRNTKKKN